MSVRRKFVKCSHKRKKDKFSNSQISHFDESSKSSQSILLAFRLLLLLLSLSYELYKIERISFIRFSTRACSKCAIIRPRQHSLVVLASSMAILSLLVFIYAIFFGLEIDMPGTCSKSMVRKL